MSGKAIRETLGCMAAVAGLVFVGLEIRQNGYRAQAEHRPNEPDERVVRRVRQRGVLAARAKAESDAVLGRLLLIGPSRS